MTQFRVRPHRAPEALHASPCWGPCFGVPDLVVGNSRGNATDSFNAGSNCAMFGHADEGVYTDSVGVGPRVFCGSGEPDGSFVPLDVEVYHML